MALGIWKALETVPFVGSVVKGTNAAAGALGLDGALNINPESTYSPTGITPNVPEERTPEPFPETTTEPPTDSQSLLDSLVNKGTDWAADVTVEKIPGWDSEKSATENVAGGVKVITDAFGNAVKAVEGVGSSITNGVKKYGPLVLAGGLALLLLKK